MSSINIPNSIITIDESAFTECTKLTSIIIPDSVISIEYHAFNSCNFNTINIPNSVKHIGTMCFTNTNCNVYYDGSISNWEEIYEDYYGRVTNGHVYCSAGVINLKYNVPCFSINTPVLLSDGTVLRVSTEARSLRSVFMQIFPITLIVILVIIIVCVFISHLLTQRLMLPIKEMSENIDDVPADSVYKELSPFIVRIREQHENILAAAKNRQDFPANVSHELKTPLTAISGYAELIENKMVDGETQVKFAGDIKKNADRLVTLINDIIRLSEIDHSEAGVNFSEENLFEVAKERVELLQNNAEKKNVTLNLYGEDTFVLSNRGMLIELLDNLIQNAIRYNVSKQINASIIIYLFRFYKNCSSINYKT